MYGVEVCLFGFLFVYLFIYLFASPGLGTCSYQANGMSPDYPLRQRTDGELSWLNSLWRNVPTVVWNHELIGS